MKIRILFLLVFVFSIQVSAQKVFSLKSPNSEKLKKEFIKSNSQMNTILTYLEANYKATTQKTNVLKDSEMGGVECGFTKKFEFGIQYTYHNCGEAAPMKEEIVFPKTKIIELKKWVEKIYKSEPDSNQNIWYPNKNEYGPKDKEVGCYYKIKQTKGKSIIETFCGC
tara:strand:+ start:33420 stop:33920 length:501 start_codon:yes stop_codon:yes gene_type:complete